MLPLSNSIMENQRWQTGSRSPKAQHLEIIPFESYEIGICRETTSPTNQRILPQIPQHQPAKPKKYNHASPEYPLILLRPPLHHANRVPTNPQRIRYTIQLALRALQHLALMSQVAQHSAATVQELV